MVWIEKNFGSPSAADSASRLQRTMMKMPNSEAMNYPPAKDGWVSIRPNRSYGLPASRNHCFLGLTTVIHRRILHRLTRFIASLGSLGISTQKQLKGFPANPSHLGVPLFLLEGWPLAYVRPCWSIQLTVRKMLLQLACSFTSLYIFLLLVKGGSHLTH